MKKPYKVKYLILFFLCMVINIIIIGFLLNIGINKDQTVSSSIILLAIAIFAITIIVLNIFNKIIKDTEKELEQKRQIEQYKLEHKYSEELNIALDNLRIIKHDLKNHISCMWGLVESDNLGDLRSYLSNLTEEVKERDLVYIQGETTISALLNHKYSIVKDKNIIIDYNLDVNEPVLIDKTDLCQILGNIIDNAVEANEKLEESERHIKFSLSTKTNHIFINIENPYDGKANVKEGNIITTKKDKFNHGLGLKSVRNTVNKHNGNIDIKFDDKTFNVNIIIPNRKTDEK